MYRMPLWITLCLAAMNVAPVLGQQAIQGASVNGYAVFASDHPRHKTDFVQIQFIASSDLAEILAKQFKDAVFIVDPKPNKLIFNVNTKDYDQLKKKIVELDVLPPQIKVDCVLKGIGKHGEEVLASPSITTADGQAARLLIGQSFPTRKEKDGSTFYEDFGLQFIVLPKLLSDGRWQVDCTMNISEIVPSKSGDAGDVKVLRRIARCVTAVRSGDSVQMEINMDDAGEVRRLLMFTVHETK